MTGKERDQKRQQWKELVQLWEASGLSAAQFCRDMQIQYDHFLYYKGLFQGRTEGWREIVDPTEETGISVKIEATTISIEKHFDSLTLKRVVKVLSGAGTAE